MTISVERFKNWLTGAQKGSSIVYHVGPHAFGDVCHEAWRAHECNLVCLTQRAVMTSTGLRKFEYIATRKSKGVKWK
jgi:hypothetical protein